MTSAVHYINLSARKVCEFQIPWRVQTDK